jgi:hypothetical protein
MRRILIFAAAARHSDNKEAFDNVALQLQRFQPSCFYVLKWALASRPDQSVETFIDEMVHEAQALGGKYETLVDALKLRNTAQSFSLGSLRRLN